MTQIRYEKDADLSLIRGKKVAVIGFGSQGIVQDVVTGLTVLLTDMFDVADMVQIERP